MRSWTVLRRRESNKHTAPSKGEAVLDYHIEESSRLSEDVRELVGSRTRIMGYQNVFDTRHGDDEDGLPILHPS
jgi:hypothetical protein